MADNLAVGDRVVAIGGSCTKEKFVGMIGIVRDIWPVQDAFNKCCQHPNAAQIIVYMNDILYRACPHGVRRVPPDWDAKTTWDQMGFTPTVKRQELDHA